jgi:hypothetical protein
MLALGLILILLAAGFLLAALAGGADDQAAFAAGSFDMELSTMAVFLLGAGTLLVFVIGLELVRSGLRRGHRRRKESKQLDRLSARLEDRDGDSRREAGDPE